MTCEEVRPLLGAFYDNEIVDIVLNQRIHSHLETCETCAKELEAITHVSTSLRAAPTRFTMPANLADRIKEETGVRGALDDIEKRGFKPWRIWAAALVPVLCLVAVGAIVMFLFDHPISRIEDDVVADHVRSLQANHLFDVPSTDQHTVKPWFQGKLDFSPSVPELSPKGFPLLGGRLDYVSNRNAAALVYGRAKHVINVLVVRHVNGRDTPDGVEDSHGYHVIGWTKGGLDYWAVSDVNSSDLEAFRTEFIAAS